MKTFEDCLEAVKPEWAIEIEDDGSIRYVRESDWKSNRNFSSERKARQMVAIKDMMVIAEAVGMESNWIWYILNTVVQGFNISDGDWIWGEPEIAFLRICQDPDGDGDESKNLFNPFKPE